MIRGLYTSGLGMMKETKRLDVISNNLANVSTNGFKAQGATNGNFTELLTKVQMGKNQIGMENYTPDTVTTYTDFEQGSLMSTESDTDCAIINDNYAFFEVEADDQTPYYTRNGAFLVNKEGYLVTSDNYKVKGEKGYIKLPTNEDILISVTGQVLDASGNEIDKLSIKSFENPQTLKRMGDTYLAMTEESKTKEFSGEIQQNYLEMSNVNSISEMVDLIEITRAYEANQKVLKANDDILSQSTSIGRIS